jgi:hypothetical protein
MKTNFTYTDYDHLSPVDRLAAMVEAREAAREDIEHHRGYFNPYAPADPRHEAYRNVFLAFFWSLMETGG